MTHQLTLAIETSNPSAGDGGVALGLGRVLDVEPLAPTGRHDDDLMPAIDRLMRRAGRTPRELVRVAVSVGPGGFTGLRIAVATGKMIAESVGAACVAVPSALVVAGRVEHGGSPFAVALASKGEKAWVTPFDATGQMIGPGQLMGEAGLANLDIGLVVADRFLPESMRSRAIAMGWRIVEPIFDARVCFEASLALPDVDPVDLVPIYPREPEAVRLWRSRG